MSANTFKEALDSSGMVDTRRNSLKYAMENLHSSIAMMDDHHLRILQEDFPDILNAARTYAAYENGLNRFERVKLVAGKAVTTN
jgi:hypothetical protein